MIERDFPANLSEARAMAAVYRFRAKHFHLTPASDVNHAVHRHIRVDKTPVFGVDRMTGEIVTEAEADEEILLSRWEKALRVTTPEDVAENIKRIQKERTARELAVYIRSFE